MTDKALDFFFEEMDSQIQELTRQDVLVGRYIAMERKPDRDTKSLVIGVDFDGTVVKDAFPKVGKEVPGAVSVLRDLVDAGHRLILWTVRSGDSLAEAVKFFRERDLPLFGINNNPDQSSWSDSPKAHCNIFIDDKALGCPLVMTRGKPYVHWPEVSGWLEDEGIL